MFRSIRRNINDSNKRWSSPKLIDNNNLKSTTTHIAMLRNTQNLKIKNKQHKSLTELISTAIKTNITICIKKHAIKIKNKIFNEKGSATLETAIVLPVIVLALCAIFFAGNLGITYLKIQDTAHSCAASISREKTNDICMKIHNRNTPKAKIFIKNNKDITTVTLEQTVKIFPAIPAVTIKTSSTSYNSGE